MRVFNLQEEGDQEVGFRAATLRMVVSRSWLALSVPVVPKVVPKALQKACHTWDVNSLTSFGDDVRGEPVESAWRMMMMFCSEGTMGSRSA